MTFRENESRERGPVARENLAVLRDAALTRLKHDDAKISLRNRGVTPPAAISDIWQSCCSSRRRQRP
jgi:hypothetical protein